MRGALTLAVFLLGGCAVDPIPQPLCLPGAQTGCVCPRGALGVQLCGSDRVLGACSCDDGGATDGAALVDRASLSDLDPRDLPTGVDRQAAPDLGSRDAGAPDDLPMADDGRSADTELDPARCGGHGNGGDPCCDVRRCNPGYLCEQLPDASGTACLRCGGNREICCEGNRCDEPRACEEGTCL